MASSWGRYPRVQQETIPVCDRSSSLPGFPGKGLPHGNGRSYGDSCLCPGGTVLLTKGLDRFIHFDPASGLLDCEPGVLLTDIIDLALPHGWFLPVTPGTRYVTVGGAIANDVHGKNHASAGSFGDHVEAFELLRSDGERRICTGSTNHDWFSATVGGLGLTGLLTRAQLQLRRVPGAVLDVETQRFEKLDDFFSLSSQDSGHEYNVAWVDCLARGRQLGRGVLIRANHCAAAPLETGKGVARLPVAPPFSLVNNLSLRLFNTLYFKRALRRRMTQQLNYLQYFYPLDRIANWNLMYGPNGFLQYQCVVPPEDASTVVRELLDRIAAAGQGSFLAVLKQFGNRRSRGWMSFPRPGTTLALDFPYRGDKTLQLLDTLDQTVLTAGGAVYPAKDARMSAEMFAASFPELERFRAYIDPQFSSGLWRRVAEDA